jgi:hypothetical protein
MRDLNNLNAQSSASLPYRWFDSGSTMTLSNHLSFTFTGLQVAKSGESM